MSHYADELEDAPELDDLEDLPELADKSEADDLEDLSESVPAAEDESAFLGISTDPGEPAEFLTEEPFTVTQTFRAYRLSARALGELNTYQHRSLLCLLCAQYYLRIKDGFEAHICAHNTESLINAARAAWLQQSSLEKKWTKKEKHEGKHLTLLEKVAEFGQKREKLDGLAKENMRQMRELVRTIQSENARALDAEAEVAEATAALAESDALVADALAQFGIGHTPAAIADDGGSKKAKAKPKSNNKSKGKGKGKKI
jgi:hypothetical protein